MSAKKKKKLLKNVAYLVSRNKTKQEVLKVIFPNGIEVGLRDGKFHNGAKVNGNMQVTGIINADDVRIKGVSISSDSGTAISFEPPVIIVDAETGGRVPTPPATAFTKVSISSSSTFTWGGHNAGRAVTSTTSYEVVSANVTGICDNTSGTSLTATVTDASAEGDDSYRISLVNGSSTTILQFLVSKDSGNAKFLVSSVAEHATGTEDWTSCIVTVPIKTSTATTNKTFTFQKNLPGTTGTDGVSVDLTRSVVPVDTDSTGGALDDGGDLSDADISDQAFTKIDAGIGATNVTFAGHNESGDPSSNTYKIVSDSITATTDNGTSLTESNSASEGDTSYNVTFANDSGTRLTLAVSTDSSDAKLRVSSLSEHEDGSSTDFNSILIDIPIKITTAAGTSTVTRSFTVQKVKQGHSTPSFGLTQSVITIPTDENGGAIDDGNDLSDADIDNNATTKADVNAGSTSFTWGGVGLAPATYTTVDTYRHIVASSTAVTNNGTDLDDVTTTLGSTPGDTDYRLHFKQSGNSNIVLSFRITADSDDMQFRVRQLSRYEEDANSNEFESIIVTVPLRAITPTGQIDATRSFTVQKAKAPASTPSVSISPGIIPIETSVTGGVPNGVASPTVTGVGAGIGGRSDIYSGSIPSSAFVKADAFAGSAGLVYNGFISGSAFASAGQFNIQGHQITASLDTGTVVSASVPAFPSDGTKVFGITGSIGITPIFNLQAENAGNDLKLGLTFLSEHDNSSNDFDNVKIDIPFATHKNNNVVRSFTIQKQKKALDGAAGADGASASAILTATGAGDLVNGINQGGSRSAANYFVESAPSSGLFDGYRNANATLQAASTVDGTNGASTDPIDVGDVADVKKAAIFVMPANGKIHQIFGDITFTGPNSGALYSSGQDVIKLRAFLSSHAHDDGSLTDDANELATLRINNNTTHTMTNLARDETEHVAFDSSYSSSGVSASEGFMLLLAMHNDNAGTINDNLSSATFNFTVLYSLT